MGKYSREFKEEALKLSDEIGVKNAAGQLGIAYYTLADWRSTRKNAVPKKELSKTAQESRIRELERENAELRTAMKAALGFFAKDWKKLRPQNGIFLSLSAEKHTQLSKCVMFSA